jgi:hypothetical protein
MDAAQACDGDPDRAAEEAAGDILAGGMQFDLLRALAGTQPILPGAREGSRRGSSVHHGIAAQATA